MGAGHGIRARERRAFTLVETIATLVVIGILSVLSSRLVVDASDQYLGAVSRARLCGEMSSALERLTSELRSIPIRTASDPVAPDVTSVSPTSIAWNDGVAARTLTLSGTDLVSTSAGASGVLLQDVASFALSAFDESDAPLAGTLSGSACDAIRRLEITITCARGGVQETLRTLVFLRAGIEGGGS